MMLAGDAATWRAPAALVTLLRRWIEEADRLGDSGLLVSTQRAAIIALRDECRG